MIMMMVVVILLGVVSQLQGYFAARLGHALLFVLSLGAGVGVSTTKELLGIVAEGIGRHGCVLH